MLFDRNRLAAHHGFVDVGRTLKDDTVDRHLFSGSHSQAIADDDVFERDVFLAAVVAQTPCRFGCQAENFFDRGARLTASAQLEHLTEQYQRHDHASGLEVHLHNASLAAEGSGEDPG
jgi:hypothetical protein